MASLCTTDLEWEEYCRFRAAFAQVIDPAYYPLEWLDGQVFTGKMRLFSTQNSAILTSIKCYPSGLKELHGEIATGELPEIVSVLIPHAEQYAREEGCAVAVISSREGWGKVMRDYDLYQTSIRKVL